MNLFNVEKQFNEIFDVEELKNLTLNSLKLFLSNLNEREVREINSRLEEVELKDLKITYESFELTLNYNYNYDNVPGFLICYSLSKPEGCCSDYCYYLKFDMNGNALTEHFIEEFPHFTTEALKITNCL